MHRVLLIQLSCVVACGRAPATSKRAAPDELVTQLEAELSAAPSNGAVIYALAVRHDRLGRVAPALGWLEKLAGTDWDAGVSSSRSGSPSRPASPTSPRPDPLAALHGIAERRVTAGGGGAGAARARALGSDRRQMGRRAARSGGAPPGA